MSSTSQKHRNFVAEPMAEKPVTELAGVGEVLGKRLETAGFDKVDLNDTEMSSANLEVKGKMIVFSSLATGATTTMVDWLQKAYTVLGQFLVLKKDKELFQEWLKDTCNANSKQSADCYQCLKDWCDEFL